MNLLNSFIHGAAVTEIFLEGHNPYAQQKLDASDVDALRQKLHSDETLLGYALGRIVGSGQGVWLLTDRALILRNARQQGAERLALDQLQRLESVRGRYGHVLRLAALGRNHCLIGVDRELAGELANALAARGVPSTHEDKPARSWFWRDAAPAGWMQDCLQDARKRLSLA